MKLIWSWCATGHFCFFAAIFEGALNVKFLIGCFSPKPGHVWYQIEGLDERKTLMAM